MTQTLKAAKPKYKFSFVMPVYNVEAFLAETVESILSQTMDFKGNCEIIFVNDGSKDNSAAICQEYLERYPENILYIEQKNAGVSSARNKGIENASGKYISFLDSDDKLSPDTLDKVYDFFEQHQGAIDLVAIPIEFFSAQTGGHMLNYKFTNSHVVDIAEEYENIQLSGGSIFVRNEFFQKNPEIRFDQNLKYAEDAKFVSEVVLEKMAYGVVVGPIYYYRKRIGGGSALGNTLHDKSWYLDVPKKVHEYLFTRSKQRFGSIPRYIQFVAMYDLQWKFKNTRQSTLDVQEVKQFKALLKDLLQYIDDDIILAQRHISIEHKLFILSFKHGQSVIENAKRKGHSYYYGDTLIFNYKDAAPKLDVEFLNFRDGQLIFEGFVRNITFPGTTYELDIDGERVPLKLGKNRKRATFFGEKITVDNGYKVAIPVKTDRSVILPQLRVDGKTYPLQLSTHRFSYLNNMSRNSYRELGGVIVRRGIESLTIEKSTTSTKIVRELHYILSLARRLKLDIFKAALQEQGGKYRVVKAATIPFRSIMRNLYVIFWRLVHHITRAFTRKKIWIISDRIGVAGDNGEALFRHLHDNPPSNPKVKVYFSIAKNSKDYQRMQQYGDVIDRSSFKYKVLFLLSDKIISSHADDFVINAFGRFWSDLIDLYKFDFVFLQHGVIIHDISGWLNRYNKNMSLFVTSAHPEYAAVLKENYGYDADVVKLTGLPRYDLLENKPAGKLIITPTWRQSLAGITNEKTGVRGKTGSFKQTDYYKFYQGLMDNQRLQEVLKKHNMSGELYLHPALSSQIDDFKGNKSFAIKHLPYDYNTAFKEGDVMVTDYSSLFLDFAYLKKPIVYTHFDSKTIFNNHFFEKGYFSYEKDGFGPVVYDYDSAIETIIKTIESGCVMQEKYKKRVKSFFYKFDKNHSRRVVKEIEALDKRK